MAISSELEQLLASWIPRQPWFPKLAADFGSDPDITPMSVARAFTYTAEELGGFVGLVTVISVGDGPTLRRLNIPLTLRGAEDMHLRHALIGHIDELALGPMYVYDGAADPVFVNLMADAITKRKVFDGGQLSTESLRHSQEKTEARDRAPMPFPVSANGSPASVTGSDTPAEVVPPKPSRAAIEVAEGDDLPVEIRPIEVSDSGPHKSTVIIHDEYEPMELSFFRVLENGMPSSLTIPVLLTEAGSRSVPEVIGWGSGRWYDMFEVQEMEAPMALLSHVDVEAEPAWREAVDTVCAVDSGSIGAYNAHAAEMGRRIGELHADMAAEFGVVEGGGEPTEQLVAKWIERIDWALGRAPLALDALVPELRAHRSKVQGLETIGTLQKIHGELTLDHVVSSPSDGYSVVKFTDSTDSDPKPAAFDLVALLRSIDYAAGFARLQRTDALDSEDGTLVVNGFGSDPSALRAIIDSPEYLWASQVQNSLLSGYSRARGESVGLNDPVLRAALVDRLLVEVVTELRNRPNWLSVPLATLTLVLKGKPAREEETTESRPAWADSAEAGSDAAEDSSASDDSDGAADAKVSDAELNRVIRSLWPLLPTRRRPPIRNRSLRHPAEHPAPSRLRSRTRRPKTQTPKSRPPRSRLRRAAQAKRRSQSLKPVDPKPMRSTSSIPRRTPLTLSRMPTSTMSRTPPWFRLRTMLLKRRRLKTKSSSMRKKRKFRSDESRPLSRLAVPPRRTPTAPDTNRSRPSRRTHRSSAIPGVSVRITAVTAAHSANRFPTDRPRAAMMPRHGPASRRAVPASRRAVPAKFRHLPADPCSMTSWAPSASGTG
jgi:maltokinase